MKIGYVRVSTESQNAARQEEPMNQLQVDFVYQDIGSGKNKERPQLNEMLNFVRKGDAIIVESISRFARNTKDFLELMEILQEKKVGFVSKKEAIDTSTPTGRFMLTVFAAVAELEREYLLQRQKEGIAIAKGRGVYMGRKPKTLNNYDEVIQLWKNKEITAVQAMKKLGVSKSTFYRLLKNRK